MTVLGSAKARRSLPRIGLALALVALGQLVLIPSRASAAGTTFNVSTTADIASNAGACGDSSIKTAPSPLSLREATCLANNVGGSVTINVPAGSYVLTSGELQPGIASGQTVTINGAGSASTVISGNNASRVFDIDPSSVGGVNSNLSGMTVTSGRDSTFGGGGILAGAGNATTSDIMTINAMVITNNEENFSTPNATNNYGGGLSFQGGQLTVTNSTFSNNKSHSSAGGGLFFEAENAASPEGLTIDGSTFSGNLETNSNPSGSIGNGGALAVQGATGSFSVTNSRFVGNTVTASTGPAEGGAIRAQGGGSLTVTESTFTGNSVSGGSGSPSGGAIFAGISNEALHYNRFVGNTAPTGSAIARVSGTGNETENWFGCNGGPGAAGCDTVAGATVAPRLVLTATASPATVVGPNATSTISGSLVTDSAGAAVSGSNLDAFDSLPATFSDPPGDATVTTSAGPHTAAFGTGAGHADIDYHSGTVTGPDPVNVSFDNATVTATPTVDAAPSITSPNTATFSIGQAGSFTVTTAGYPNPAITRTGTVPAGLTFTDNGDGTATLAGTPTGPGGTFPLNLTANNGVSPNATQTLTVSVGQPPAFTSPSTATFQTGTAGTFTVTTSGVPTVSTISESGTLPSGLTYHDNGDGTATLSGTPAAGTGGTYPVTLTATNGVSPNGTQNLTIQVNQPPAVTTNPSDQTVQPGTSVTFTAAASGVPTPSVQWQVSSDGGASFANVAGATSTSLTFTAAAGDNGNEYRAVFTNAVGTATSTAATLNVGTAPAFTSADTTTFTVGQTGTFTVTASGVPTPVFSHLAPGYPGTWLHLNDNANNTATLTGTPPAGSAGTYTFTLKAANGFGTSAVQTFTLLVDAPPTITSADHATFTAGTAGSFAITTTAGFPTATTISETGTLPSGVTLTDHGDGTASLAGTPAVGTGGVYPITIAANATGGTTAPSTQSFTLTVNEVPRFTSTDHATLVAGAAGSFTVTTAAGYPLATALAQTGTLPSGVTFHDNGNGTATIGGTPNQGTAGDYTLTLTATNTTGSSNQNFTLTINEAPRITSANKATFTVGVAAAFTVTTSPADPAPVTLTETGPLPAGVTFVDNHDGTATLGGTPTAGDGGIYPLTITATNGVDPDGTQSFTLTVKEPPTITSADHTTFKVGSAGSFTVTTTAGQPSGTTLTEPVALPSGVTFHDNGDGTATLAGTPAAGTGGTYSLSITASNGVSPSATQPFTLTINEPPSISSADHTNFQLGGASTFTITTAGGFPTPATLSQTGALPAGVTFTPHADGTATLAGTPTQGGVFNLVITAANGVTPNDTQAFTLTVNSAPSITSADHTTFAVGSAGTFTVTTNPGTPSSTTLSVPPGSLPSGVTFHDNHNGTATLAGTPAAGTGGTYPITITASNGVQPDTTQSFTLTVTALPAFTSPAAKAFVVGAAGSFTVTTTAGYPTATTLSVPPASLPSGLTFHDNGDGTATLAGTPAAGTGGSYPLSLRAANSAGYVDQAFTLTVNETSAITSLDHATFVAGTAAAFTVTTAGGYPTPPTLTEAGLLPPGVTFHDNGNGTATLGGTPTAGGIYSLTITAANGASTDATQTFTLTVNGPPSITSASTTTFTEGVTGTFTVTTRAGVPATPITLSSTGTLPAGVTFTDNSDGTATLAGVSKAAGSFALTFTASNGIAPDASQAFTLKVQPAPAVVLSAILPASAGTLTGVPAHTTVGQTLHLRGTGFAAGAPVTIGVYPTPVVIGHAVANSSGTFTATVTVPNRLGRRTFVAAGVAGDGDPQYLEARSIISARPSRGSGSGDGSGLGTGSGPVTGPGSGTSAGSGGLADTGPDTDPRTTAGWAFGLALFGFGLTLAARRRRRSNEL